MVPLTAKGTFGKRHNLKIFGVRRFNTLPMDSITEIRRSKYVSRGASNKEKPFFRTSADTLRVAPGHFLFA